MFVDCKRCIALCSPFLYWVGSSRLTIVNLILTYHQV
uniref:Uncharacterized protein n=1 Tax=Dulem virus 31 TaxID=3145749 RepID=A0AAU8AV59_9VIRU